MEVISGIWLKGVRKTMNILSPDVHCLLLKSEPFPPIVRVKVVLLAPYWAVASDLSWPR
jgi:hypothetical protein